MKMRRVVFSLLAGVLAVLGYFFFGIVVAIYAGLWLHHEKMFYAQGIPAQLFGAAGAAAGVFLAWLIWRLSTRTARSARPARL
jgi:formate-dependent nitrite reductase membrane component NrfD